MREITTYCVRVISFSYILRVINTTHSTWLELMALMLFEATGSWKHIHDYW